jgi:hypothetical protein
MLAAASNAGYADGKSAYTIWSAWTPLMQKSYLYDPSWTIIPERTDAQAALQRGRHDKDARLQFV